MFDSEGSIGFKKTSINHSIKSKGEFVYPIVNVNEVISSHKLLIISKFNERTFLAEH